MAYDLFYRKKSRLFTSDELSGVLTVMKG